LNSDVSTAKQQQLLGDILNFVARASGLRASKTSAEDIRLHQLADGKSIVIDAKKLDEVLWRTDTQSAEFVQVNFLNGHKILLTETLVGFKPGTPPGIDHSRLPRVVTTPDVVNVFEAIQDVLHQSGPRSHELSVLKKVFDAVLMGGEDAGFDLAEERTWLARLPTNLAKASS
jgi:hypothetical protein